MRKVMTALLACVVAAVVAGCGRDPGSMSEERLARMPVPPFRLQSIEGETVSLEDHLKDRVILLDFSATWCPPCAEAIPALKKIQKRSGEELQGLAIYVNEPLGTVKSYAGRHGLEHTVLLDVDGAVATRYGVKSIPTFVVIDLDGKMRYYGNNVNAAGRVVEKLLTE